jgi:hypothetical protein
MTSASAGIASAALSTHPARMDLNMTTSLL